MYSLCSSVDINKGNCIETQNNKSDGTYDAGQLIAGEDVPLRIRDKTDIVKRMITLNGNL